MSETNTEQHIIKSVNIWKEYFNLYYKHTENFILYDKWYSDIDYREEVANRFGLVNVEDDIDKIIGHGISSFDRKKRVVDDDVLKRYTEFKDDPLYRKYVIEDVELKVMWNSLVSYFNLDDNHSYLCMF